MLCFIWRKFWNLNSLLLSVCVERLCGWGMCASAGTFGFLGGWLQGGAWGMGSRGGLSSLPKHWDWLPVELSGACRGFSPLLSVPPFSLFSATPVIQSLLSLWAPTQLSPKDGGGAEWHRTWARQLWGWFAHRQGTARPEAWAAIWETLGTQARTSGLDVGSPRGESAAPPHDGLSANRPPSLFSPSPVARFHFGSSRQVACRSFSVPCGATSLGAEKPGEGLSSLA